MLSRREASIFACVTDAVVEPQPVLPPVRETDAVRFFDDWMARAPALNRHGLRALLYVVELAPLLTGFGARLRRLSRERRVEWLHAAEAARVPQLRLVAKLLKGAAQLSYYGDDRVMLRTGYDGEANLRRGRELRIREGRP